MNWEQIRPAIKTLIGDLSGLTTLWEDEPRPYEWTPPDTPAFCTISVTSSVGQGSDENRIQQDLNQSIGQELQDVWIGNRDLTLTVKVESEIQTDNGNAYFYIERIRDRMWFRSSRAAMHAVNVAIRDLLPAVDLTTTRDNRKRSIAAFDILLTARNLTVDPVRYPYIATWDISGTLAV